jgi:dethiobiotin synthetase/adenosylmethionine--8-amino-7-oxononanoate aminotransferase
MIFNFPAFYVFGANTGIGKTLFSSLLASTAQAFGKKVVYLKPLQTGFPEDSDAATVANSCAVGIEAKCLFAWKKPVSPHLAEAEEKTGIKSVDILNRLRSECERIEKEHANNLTQMPFVLIEGAGGVASPSCDDTLQCDLFRRFRLPCILVGDSKLGGISTTLAAYELLNARGFDIPLLLFAQNNLENHLVVEKHVKPQTKVIIIPIDLLATEKLDFEKVKADAHVEMGHAFQCLTQFHQMQHELSCAMKERSSQIFWWPFTQHAAQSETQIITSAYDDLYEVYDCQKQRSQELFDGSASWWTQGAGHGVPALSRALAYANGRYGHVLFPDNSHESAFCLTEELLSSLGAPWASRVFYSDNGSTAVEVALKMAMRVTATKRGVQKEALKVLGLADSYHGDTLGAMDAASPNTFNARDLWYQGRGAWLTPPEVIYKNETHSIALPPDLKQLYHQQNNATSCPSFTREADLYSTSRQSSDLCHFYTSYLQRTLNEYLAAGVVFGALLLEPVVHGSGGMKHIDPLFQWCLAAEARRLQIPVILDEVFSGFWRFGPATAGKLLSIQPDIACYAKALTGGTVPLAVTLATEAVFEAFLGTSKSEALLHGHSYTAYPIACEAARTALNIYKTSPRYLVQKDLMESPWPTEQIRNISHLENVSRVVAMGSVFAVELQSDQTGYASKSANGFLKSLRQRGIMARPLGNVVYLMGSARMTFDEGAHLGKIIEEELKKAWQNL